MLKLKPRLVFAAVVIFVVEVRLLLAVVRSADESGGAVAVVVGVAVALAGLAGAAVAVVVVALGHCVWY